MPVRLRRLLGIERNEDGCWCAEKEVLIIRVSMLLFSVGGYSQTTSFTDRHQSLFFVVTPCGCVFVGDPNTSIWLAKYCNSYQLIAVDARHDMFLPASLCFCGHTCAVNDFVGANDRFQAITQFVEMIGVEFGDN